MSVSNVLKHKILLYSIYYLHSLSYASLLDFKGFIHKGI